MAEHKDLLDTTAHCHTPQQFAAASNDTVMTKNSSGALVWLAKSAIGGDLPHAHAYISTPAATSISVAGTYQAAAGTWTSTEADEITFAAGVWTIDSGQDGAYLLHITGNWQCDNLNDIIGLDIAINDTVQGYGLLRTKCLDAGDPESFSGSFYLEGLSAADTVKVFVTDETDTNSVTITNASVLLQLIHT